MVICKVKTENMWVTSLILYYKATCNGIEKLKKTGSFVKKKEVKHLEIKLYSPFVQHFLVPSIVPIAVLAAPKRKLRVQIASTVVTF